MNIKSLYPSCTVKVVFSDLSSKNVSGLYFPVQDVIALCSSLKTGLPICRDITYLHELFHATGHRTRSLRRSRLVANFGPKAERVEECIAEIATMIALQKLGMLNKYSRIIPEEGIIKYYDSDIYIPWREVVGAVNYFKDPDIDFTKETEEVKRYLISTFNVIIKDTYAGIRN